MAYLLRICTYNVGNPSDAKVKDDLQACRAASDVVYLQEVADRKNIVNATDSWGLWQPEGSNKEHNAITWRKSALTLDKGSDGTVDPTTCVWLHDADPSIKTGKGQVKKGWMLHVRLRHKDTGRLIHACNLHMIASVQGDNANPKDKDKRQKIYKQDVSNIVKACNGWDGGAVFVGADWNAPPDFNLLNPLSNANLKLGYTPKNTHGSRNIDYIYQRKTDAVSFKAQYIVDGCHSDHRALCVHFNVTHK